MLIQVSASKGENYVQIELKDIEHIIVNPQKSNNNSLKLKDGREFIFALKKHSVL